MKIAKKSTRWFRFRFFFFTPTWLGEPQNKNEQEEKEEKIQQGGWFTAKAATASAHMRSIAARMPSLNEKAAR